MYFTQYAITEQGIIQHISDDFTYLVKNQFGGNQPYLSRDIGSIEGIATIVQISNIVEQIATSAQLAVKFATTIHGKRCLGVTPLGHTLYEFLLNPHRFSPPPRQQLNEALDLWQRITPRILGMNPCFSGDPMHRMNDQAVLEGELLNEVVIAVREYARRKAFKSATAARRKDVQRIDAATSKLVIGLLDQHPNMYGLRVDLMYDQAYAEKVRVKESAEHVQSLIEGLNDDLWFGTSLGFLWTRHFLSEAGYRFNLLLLFDPKITPKQMIDQTKVLKQWLSSTRGAGLDYVLPDGFFKTEELLRYLECSKRAALYLRLTPDAKFPHVGMSELPSKKSLSELEHGPSCSTSGESGGFGRGQPGGLGTSSINRFW